MYINGYELYGELEAENSGFSKWGFCRKNGREYFIKEFLYPTYPVGDMVRENLSPEQIAKIIRECREFEKRLINIYSMINRVSDGNIVRIKDFIRFNSKYYIITDKVPNSELTVERISRLPYEDKKFICKIVSHAILRLHDQGFIHADIKPNNILIGSDGRNYKYTAKIIDFDCGFFGTEPPEPGTELNGDPVYFAPEMVMHMMEEEVALSCKIDVFSLGVLFHQYMTGKQPIYDTSNYDYVTEAILEESPVAIDSSIPHEFAVIISKMLIKNPQDRISLQEVYDSIKLEHKEPAARYEEPPVRHEEKISNSKIKIYQGNKNN